MYDPQSTRKKPESASTARTKRTSSAFKKQRSTRAKPLFPPAKRTLLLNRLNEVQGFCALPWASPAKPCVAGRFLHSAPGVTLIACSSAPGLRGFCLCDACRSSFGIGSATALGELNVFLWSFFALVNCDCIHLGSHRHNSFDDRLEPRWGPCGRNRDRWVRVLLDAGATQQGPRHWQRHSVKWEVARLQHLACWEAYQ